MTECTPILPGGFAAALDLIGQLEDSRATLAPQACADLAAGIFRACGYAVTDAGFIGSDAGADCFVQTRIGGRDQRIAVEVQMARRPVRATHVQKSIALASHPSRAFDRAMILARSGFSQAAFAEAESHGLGKVDLFDPPALRAWLEKQHWTQCNGNSGEIIIRSAMRALAAEIANNPALLAEILWFDLERILRETFEAQGWTTRLTRPAKDGGFDLELEAGQDGHRSRYIIEVKHWSRQRPGSRHLHKLIKVAATKEVTGAILLSSSGFTRTICSGISDFSFPAHFADKSKIIALCKSYYRIAEGLWIPDMDIETDLPDNTHCLADAARAGNQTGD